MMTTSGLVNSELLCEKYKKGNVISYKIHTNEQIKPSLFFRSSAIPGSEIGFRIYFIHCLNSRAVPGT